MYMDARYEPNVKIRLIVIQFEVIYHTRLIETFSNVNAHITHLVHTMIKCD